CVQPPVKFVTHRTQDTYVLKPELLVQSDRGNVSAISDDRDHLARAGLGCLGNQALQQQAADALAGSSSMDVDGILDTESVSGTWAVGAGVGVADNGARVLRDEIRKTARENIGAAVCDLGGIGWFGLERGRSVKDVVGVDFSDRSDVSFGRRADQH